MSDLMLMIDGQPVPLDKVIWEGVGSCGCAFGWHVAVSGGRVLAATPDQAKSSLFGDNAVSQKFYEENGATIRPTVRDRIPMDRCQHTPSYGLPDADPPEGHEWATTDGMWGRQTYRRHIVPTLPTGDDRESFQARHEAVAICGKTTTNNAYTWRTKGSDRFVHLPEKVPCSKCLKAVGA